MAAIESRFTRLGSMDDLNVAVNVYEESVGLAHGPPNIRIESVAFAAYHIYSQDLKRASRLLPTAVELLHQTSLRTLRRNDQQFELSQFDELAST